MNTTAIEKAIKEAVRNNGNQEITGDIMQGILLGIVTLLKTLQEESIDSVRLESSASKIRLVITDGQGKQTASEIDLPSGSGSGTFDVPIITTSSSTVPTDSNVYSALAVDGKIKDAIGSIETTLKEL
jgi:hypothetical protein